MFAALGDQRRLRLVARLCQSGPLPIVRLTEGARVSRQAVTKHLRMLERAGLVCSLRQGRERIWTLETRRLAEANLFLAQISAQWDAAIDRLRALVEGDDRIQAEALPKAKLPYS
jgi:DNA-binding transcriptional ArsR family regulator